ncbi:MAG: single-stranded DNA-binding protein [Verrucomicrobiota bacterium]
MANLNKVMLIGNVTRDPEIRYTPKGTALVELGLAVNRRYTAENGEKREETTFVDVTFWGRTAEIANEYLKKGRSIYVEGRLQLDSWDDKTTGQKRSKLRVVGEEMQMLGSREGGGGGGGASRTEYDEEPRSSRPPQRPAGRPATPPKPPVDPDLDVEGDDIPF